jgi:Calcineurin-like phosphoesterase
MIRGFTSTLAVALLLGFCAGAASAQQPAKGAWHFVASGDSRNCGDVVMPGIAETAKKNHAAFYWHLGDLRKSSGIDEDIAHQPEHIAKPLSMQEYWNMSWQDFIDSQIKPFGEIPYFVGIGNHEVVAPAKTREGFLFQFADWRDSPALRAQRLLDSPDDHLLKTYYHWMDRGVAFYFMDSASDEQFDDAQISWFESVLKKDLASPAVNTIVVGMHKALPESISKGHSMNESERGAESGRRVYADLLRAQNDSHKYVYVLASHSHYYMDGIFNTEYWRNNGGVLPGWIVGTGGAVRYALPPNSSDAHGALVNVYGSLLATVEPGGKINFEFEKLSETDIPASVTSRYGKDFVHWCFAENTQVK